MKRIICFTIMLFSVISCGSKQLSVKEDDVTPDTAIDAYDTNTFVEETVIDNFSNEAITPEGNDLPQTETFYDNDWDVQDDFVQDDNKTQDIDNTEDVDLATPDIDQFCVPGSKAPCYIGPAGTKGVGICKAGLTTCNEFGTAWSGPCEGEVLPQVEICMNGIDEDCNGIDAAPGNVTDIDGDGYTYCTGDCCEVPAECPNATPSLLNPASAEMDLNGVDDNCNSVVDEQTSCDAPVIVSADNSASALSLANSMGICSPWLLSADLALTGTPVTEEICDGKNADIYSCIKTSRPSRTTPYFDENFRTYAVEHIFGMHLYPKEGYKIAVLSTGDWDNPTANAEEATLEAGDMKAASYLPSDWINKQTGCVIQKPPACGGLTPNPSTTDSCKGNSGPIVQDPIMLTINLKVPTNARAFRFKSYFCSMEYPSTVCNSQNYNDFFFALLDSSYNDTYPSSLKKNPYDKNIAKDRKDNPVGVDLAPEGLFKVCNVNCQMPGGINTNKWGFCTGDEELASTGFETANIMGTCSGYGCTGWLNVQGNVLPGETIKLRLALFEQGTVAYGPDHSWDSTLLLDDFKWLPDEVIPGIVPVN